jgi:hypothetical protein
LSLSPSTAKKKKKEGDRAIGQHNPMCLSPWSFRFSDDIYVFWLIFIHLFYFRFD